MHPHENLRDKPSSNTQPDQAFQYLGDGLTFPAQVSIRAMPPPANPQDNSRSSTHQDFPQHSSYKDRTHASTRDTPSWHDDRQYRYQLPYTKDSPDRYRLAQPDLPYGQSFDSYMTAPTSKSKVPPSRPRKTIRLPEQQSERFVENSPPRLVTDNAEYIIIKPLGTSPWHLSTYYLVEDIFDRALYAQKRLRMVTESERERAHVEKNAFKQIMRAGASDHITTITEAFYDGVSDHSSLILERCDHGSIEESLINRYIREYKTCPEAFAWHVLGGLATAVSLCHFGIKVHGDRPPRGWEPIYHLDIRPRNVLLSSTKKLRESDYPRVVLGDFSCVAREGDIRAGRMDEIVQRHGKQAWQPPESYDPRKPGLYGSHTDMWQIGGVIQAMCRLLNFPDQALADEGRPCGSRYSRHLNDVISWCMDSDFRKRPTAPDIRELVLRQEAAVRGYSPNH